MRCNNEILNLNLNEEQRNDVGRLLKQDKKLAIVTKLKDEYGFSHRDSKVIMDHLNKDFGKCGRCNYADLRFEYIDCPKCNAFNYNFNFTKFA